METLITLGVEVKVEPFYLPQQSKPVNNEYLYGYTIGIHNYNPYPVQLISRMWQITNGFGDVKYVEGEGVVGRQPVLYQGDDYTYTSGCPLHTPLGKMEGMYLFKNLQTNQMFEVKIPVFYFNATDVLN